MTEPIESAETPDGQALDLLVSYNAVEHLFDVPTFARQSFSLLRPGGVAVHRVDFAPHGPWQDRANPFEWLTVSDALYWMMGSARGTPNRLRFNEVARHLEKSGFEVESTLGDFLDRRFFVTSLGEDSDRSLDQPLLGGGPLLGG